MIQYIISITLSMLLSTTQANLIEWSADRKLTWKDFKASPDKNSTNAALTSSSINIEFGFSNSGLKHNIKCRFDQNLSWGRIKNDYILAHEQGHFDIAEIHARKLHKALKTYKFNSRTVSKDVNGIYVGIMKEHHSYQSLYDAETDFSRNPEKQNYWHDKIGQTLDSLQNFANYQ
ncbi:MAG: DUF922 domain-containing protein [Chitinophagaceae bacterium]|nr:DUF922 domain-containing protein [Chitinophagaceae bacterium]